MASRGHGVWFVDSEKHAWAHGNANLRFPWPSDAIKTSLVGLGDATYYFTPSGVDDEIEVKEKRTGRWRPLSDYYEEGYY
jgi:hypothetical protein